MKEKKRLEKWFSVYEVSYWALVFITDGAYSSYLKSLGYGEAFIGRMLMILGLTGMVLMPLAGLLADHLCRYRIMASAAAVLICVTVFLMHMMPSEGMVYLYTVVGGGLTKLLNGFIDSWFTKITKETEGIDYGRIRSMGSIAYALASPAFGLLFSRLGFWTAMPLCLVLTVSCLLCILNLRDPKPPEEHEKGPSFLEAFRYLLGNRSYLIFLCCSVLMNVTMQSFFGFVGLLMEEAGGTVGDLGIYYFLLAMFEFAVVRNYSRISERLGLKRTVILGMAGIFLKSLIHSFAGSVTAMYCCTVTQCFSLALTVPSNALYQRECVEKQYLSTALLVMQTCCAGLVPFLFSSAYGITAERLGVGAMLRIFSIFALIGAVLFRFMAPDDSVTEET